MGMEHMQSYSLQVAKWSIWEHSNAYFQTKLAQMKLLEKLLSNRMKKQQKREKRQNKHSNEKCPEWAGLVKMVAEDSKCQRNLELENHLKRRRKKLQRSLV